MGCSTATVIERYRKKFEFNKSDLEDFIMPEVDVIHINTIDSTMPASRGFIDEGNQLPFIYNADIQTHGKGKGARKWAGSIKGNLYTSTGIPKNKIKNEVNNKDKIVKITAISIIQELLKLNEKEFFLKYPNDILCKDNKKLGGILVEDYKDFFIIGFGINLKKKPDMSQIRAQGLSPCCVREHLSSDKDVPSPLDLSINITKNIIHNINLKEEEIVQLFEQYMNKN